MKPSYLIICLLATALFCACSITKNVPENDSLYSGYRISFQTKSLKDSDSIYNSELTKSLGKLVKPQPNSKLFGFRYRLAIYNIWHKPKQKKDITAGLSSGLLGKPPVLLSRVNIPVINRKMEDYLFSIGYLTPHINNTIQTKKRISIVNFIVDTGTHYTIRNIVWNNDSALITKVISKDSINTSLQRNADLRLSDLDVERGRIDMLLKDSGYYFFVPENILFKIDTLHNGKADVYVTIASKASQKSLEKWSIGNINLYPNYTLKRDSLLTHTIPTNYKGLWITDPKKTYTKALLRRIIVLRKNELYNRNLHQLTLERLVNLNVFKFVSMKFAADSTTNILNTSIFLTPERKFMVQLEASGNSKSNNFVGSEIAATVKNRNYFKGAEIYEGRSNFSFDIQVGGHQRSVNTYTNKSGLTLSIPKMAVPFAHISFPGSSILPRTFVTYSFEDVIRKDLYAYQSRSVSAGYIWRRTRSVENSLTVVNLSAVKPVGISASFDSVLQQDAALRASFEKQILLSSSYQYKFDNSYKFNQHFNYATILSVLSSGNLAALLAHAPGNAPGSKKELFHLPVSQFIRAEIDLRGYYKINPSLIWANRINTGLAYAYGNSDAIPYNYQFFIGGSSSLRAFRARTLGPGSYHTSKSVYEANEAGDIKIEMNSELRWSISSLFKLATFIDAGNIWLRKETPDEPGSGFEPKKLVTEMAVGTGIGVRLDLSFFLLRFDVAAPLRKPWYAKGSRWILNEIDVFDKEWRKENLVLNIGIGYPF